MPRLSRSAFRDRLRSALGGEAGNAALEFILAGVLLLVPIFYLVIALGAVQSQTMGVESAARHVARALADSAQHDPDATADAILAAIIEQYAIDPGSVTVTITCTGTTGACPQPGAIVTVTVRAEAALPMVPPILGLDELTRVPIEASAVSKASTYPEAD